MANKICGSDGGWGEVVLDTPTYVVVRWDADPWFLEQVDKCRIKNGLVS